ncbi:MAG: helix-turn-helix transcriptional regulator [Lachnospiraceae bacterium]|nr:helix-turn-helix transcriptional regulator [Lachnospiraceae bacterium]
MFNKVQQEEVSAVASISDRIKMLRTTAGMTQEQFGELFGIVKSTVSLYESGKSCPNDQMKLRICEHFNIPLDFLIGISNVAEYQAGEFNRGILSDGTCRSAFLDLMEIRKITLEQMSETTGLDIAVLENWFVKEVPSLQQLVLVADCLRTSIDYLLGRTYTPTPPSEEDLEVLSYYHQIGKMDQRWVMGQMADIIKKREAEAESIVAAADIPARKVSGK